MCWRTQVPPATGHKAWEPRRGSLMLGGKQVRVAGTHWLSVGIRGRLWFKLKTFGRGREEGGRSSFPSVWSSGCMSPARGCCSLAGPGAAGVVRALRFMCVYCDALGESGDSPICRLYGPPTQEPATLQVVPQQYMLSVTLLLRDSSWLQGLTLLGRPYEYEEAFSYTRTSCFPCPTS